MLQHTIQWEQHKAIKPEHNTNWVDLTSQMSSNTKPNAAHLQYNQLWSIYTHSQQHKPYCNKLHVAIKQETHLNITFWMLWEPGLMLLSPFMLKASSMPSPARSITFQFCTEGLPSHSPSSVKSLSNVRGRFAKTKMKIYHLPTAVQCSSQSCPVIDVW